MVQDHGQDDRNYECVEPDVGELMWQYEMPDVDPEIQRRLEDHLTVCAECRMELAVRRQLQAEPAGQDRTAAPLRLVSGPRRRLARGLVIAAVVQLAACLLLVFLLPPQDPDAGRRLRAGGASAHFLRPVTGEVVGAGNVAFAWSPIDQVSGYRLTVRDPSGDFRWSTETSATTFTLPADVELPADTRLHAYLETIPSYLTPDDGIGVAFRCGSTLSVAAYRARHTRPWIWGFGVTGLIVLGVATRLNRPPGMLESA